jgi:hypothetical protein
VSSHWMVLADFASGYDFKLSDDERCARKVSAPVRQSTNAIEQNMARTATCACGQLTVSCDGAPALVAICPIVSSARRGQEAHMASLLSPTQPCQYQRARAALHPVI